MQEHAFVTWAPVAEPWVAEDQLIATLNLPLNLRGNERHAFHPELSRIRRLAKVQAAQD
jgi:hypothetical protein